MRSLILAAVPFTILSACAVPDTALSNPFSGPDDPSIGIRTVTAPSGVAGYTPRTPSGPAPWRQSNDEQSPAHGGSN
ncbi:hypothetical protein ACFFUT_00200 [Pseudohalocynthiibacter aestuariivivens]|jgi:hypothetical protein|uniref:Lipoprotein n=1 Tax=Pseudohalocynthiibacter aestuariivivens TaxID=1591409 RepID=A0ABV5J9S8_9RHOB|nr:MULTISPECIES: hypothetical protein [Pseudohalocynthiibacter]MBS9716783.1 hypothetical protein [Pseudohalocynthiibacter aestuariivivens]MCK0102122.1 hypothetical protein [Pseudohalocynthiibacter sp. F2068]